jgi:hypothetical protein
MHLRLRSKVRGTGFLDFARNDGREGPGFSGMIRRDRARIPAQEKAREILRRAAGQRSGTPRSRFRNDTCLFWLRLREVFVSWWLTCLIR